MALEAVGAVNTGLRRSVIRIIIEGSQPAVRVGMVELFCAN